MPGLFVFGRRWEVASDDLLVPSLIESFLRFIWLIVTVVIWTYHSHYLDCEDVKTLHIYLAGTLVMLTLITTVDLVLARHSMKGTIMDTRPRRHVPRIIYIRVALAVFEIGWTVYGTVWAFRTTEACSESEMTLTVVKALVIFNWGLTLVLLVWMVLVFDPLGHHISSELEVSKELLEQVMEKRVSWWECRCKWLCCACLSCTHRRSDELKEAFTDVAGVIASLFHGLDLVPSDIAAGLLLLHLRTKRNREESRRSDQRRPITEGPRSQVLTSSPASDLALRVEFSPSAVSVAAFSPNGIDRVLMQDSPLARGHVDIDQSWMNPSNAHIYMRYALGAYGWMWYLAGGFWQGVKALHNQIVCCSCCSPHPPAQHDNCCQCNLAALKKVTDLEDQDIVYVSFRNSLYLVPFFVAVDHDTRSVVVSIRGTLSGHDALTDLAAVTDNITVEGLPVGWTAHRGMLQAAKSLYSELVDGGILEGALGQHRGYQLVVTGHSLGAGAAVLLSILLKTKYPSLRCFAFSPPGGLLSMAAARFTESFCMAVIVGDDIVPRLSLSNVESLKRQMVAELTACRHPKYHIFLTGCWEALFKQSSSNNTHPLLSDVPNNNLSYESFSDVRLQMTVNESATNELAVNISNQLYLPGRILQVEVRRAVDSVMFFDEPEYEARWMQREDYNQILVTPRMMADHSPNLVLKRLEGLARQHESMNSSINA